MQLNNQNFTLILKRGTAANLALSTTFLAEGEMVYTTDTKLLNISDGTNKLKIPVCQSAVSLTAQTANISATTLTTTGAGLYRVSYYLLDSVADLTAGTVTLTLTYTDNGAAQTVNSSSVLLTTLGTFTQGSVVVQLASGNVQYAVGHSGIFGTAKYDVFINLERIN